MIKSLKEKLVVRISDGVVQPGAIMVHSQDAPSTTGRLKTFWESHLGDALGEPIL